LVGLSLDFTVFGVKVGRCPYQIHQSGVFSEESSMDSETTKSSVIRRWLLRSTLANYVGQFVTFGTGFVLTPFVLHQIGPTSYGLWLLVGSVVAYGGLLDLGIMSAVIKYVAEYWARGQIMQVQSLIATVLSLYTVLGLIVIALAAALAPFLPALFNVAPTERATASWLVLLMGLALGISIPCTITHSVLRGLQRFDLANLISISGTLLTTAATIAVLLLGGGLLAMVTVNIPLTLLMQVPAIWLIKHSAPELRLGWRGANRHLVRTVISFSSPMFVMLVAGQLQSKTNEIVVGAFLPISAVTPYGIARRLSEVAQLLARQFEKVLLPLASQLHAENDQARLRALYTASTRLTLASFLPIGGIVVILAQPLLTIWVGAVYAEYSYLVLILTLASLIGTSQWPAASVLQGMARHRLLAVMSICSGLASLVLSIALVRDLGLTGVALGTLIAIGVECLVFVMPYAMHSIGVSAGTMFKEVFWPVLAPAIPMIILLYGLRKAIDPSSLLSVIVVAGIGLLVYAIGYLSVGANAVERQTYGGLALSAIRFAKTYLKRS
jgi:O-antigen/teichoic acid export membrane protein